MINSAYYEDINVTSWNGGDLYIYQAFSGVQYVRMVSKKTITFSGQFTNLTQNDVAIQFGINRYYDPSNDLLLARAVNLKPGINLISATLTDIPIPSVTSAGAGAELQARMYINGFTDTCNIRVHYIKAEFGRVSTPNFTDNFTEKTRVLNF